MINKYAKNSREFVNENFEIYKEDGRHYLRIDYDFEDDFGIYKCRIDKLKFDLKIKEVTLESDINARKATVKLEGTDGDFYEEVTFNTPICFTDPLFRVELVKEKVQEMTMEEIEKKLGHKIKIVSKSK